MSDIKEESKRSPAHNTFLFEQCHLDLLHYTFETSRECKIISGTSGTGVIYGRREKRMTIRKLMFVLM